MKISLLPCLYLYFSGRVGRACKLKIRLTQPNFVELGLGLSLAKNKSLTHFSNPHDSVVNHYEYFVRTNIYNLSKYR
jgi:hypothetical protein